MYLCNVFNVMFVCFFKPALQESFTELSGKELLEIILKIMMLTSVQSKRDREVVTVWES